MMVYLAGPIDDVPFDGASGWRAKAAAALQRRGMSSYNPMAAFHLVFTEHSQFVIHANAVDAINRAAIKHSSAVLAYLNGPGAAIGTAREIEFAVANGIPVVAVYTGPPRVALHDVHTCDSIEEAADRIADIVRDLVREG